MKRAQTPASEKAIEELKEVHAHERQAHFANDVDALMANQADDVIAVVDGKIHHLTADQMRENLVRAFKNATYNEFDDLQEPEIFVSDDGSLAWLAVRIRVRKSQIDDTGASQERRFVSAAIRAHEKRNGRWLRTGTSRGIMEDDGAAERTRWAALRSTFVGSLEGSDACGWTATLEFPCKRLGIEPLRRAFSSLLSRCSACRPPSWRRSCPLAD